MVGPHFCPHCPRSTLVPDPFGSAALVCPLCQHTQATVADSATSAASNWWASGPTTNTPTATTLSQPEVSANSELKPATNHRVVLAALLGLGLICFAIPVLIFALNGPERPASNQPIVAVVTPAVTPAPTPVPPIFPMLVEPVDRPLPFVEGGQPVQPAAPEPKEATPALPELPAVPEKPPVVEKQPEPPMPVAVPEAQNLRKVVGRLQKYSEEDLRRMLDDIPEIGLERVPGSTKFIVERAKIKNQRNMNFDGPLANLPPNRTDLTGLPMRMGKDCHLGKEEADNLHALSRKLRKAYEESMDQPTAAAILRAAGGVPADPRIDSERLDVALGRTRDWTTAEAVPTMMQMMQAENKPVRRVLIDRLASIPDRRATAALAMRAVTDLSPELREAALVALKTRPAEEYRPLLLAGLRYPFPAMAEHAAEALVALNDQESIPSLVKLLNLPASNLPIQVGSSNQFVVRELVRVNHLGNCVMCHQPSFDTNDMVRGAIPTPGVAIPGPATTPAYYEGSRGDFVRADVTYLRQDFSIMQPVQRPNNWPTFQRYDYLVRLRKPNARDKAGKDPSREATLFALRELTGKDLGTHSKDWEVVLLPETQPAPTVEDLVKSAGRDWRQFVTTMLPDIKAGNR